MVYAVLTRWLRRGSRLGDPMPGLGWRYRGAFLSWRRTNYVNPVLSNPCTNTQTSVVTNCVFCVLKICFFWGIFHACLRPSKIDFASAQDGSWGQLVRFRTPTWHPKSTQNPHFSCFKTNLILRCAKTQNLVRVLGMDHIFAPPGAPEIHQKSRKNRSQEPSMLRSFFDTL